MSRETRVTNPLTDMALPFGAYTEHAFSIWRLYAIACRFISISYADLDHIVTAGKAAPPTLECLIGIKGARPERW